MNEKLRRKGEDSEVSASQVVHLSFPAAALQMRASTLSAVCMRSTSTCSICCTDTKISD